MKQDTTNVLEFQQIKETISEFALTSAGKEKILELKPSTHLKQIEAMLDEVLEAVEIMKKSASVPVHGLEGMENLLNNLHKGNVLRADQFNKLSDFLDCCVKMKRYMKDKEHFAPRVSSYVDMIEELPDLAFEINHCIRNGQVDDYASKPLLKIRKQIAIQEERLKEKTMQLIRSNKYKLFLQENVVSQRNGRYVIPIKKEYKNKVKGTVLDISASGSTFFIEPEDIALFQDEINWLFADEEVEVQKILQYLTGLVEEKEAQIRLAIETMVHYDFLFAKAKYCRLIEGVRVSVNDSHDINLISAKHPLLGEKAVPLSMKMANEQNALIITGPNTGGKTVAIKTVGLLTTMTQCGLLIPVEKGSSISIYQKILVDIGDGQSITENLSTFSSRIKNIIEILKDTNEYTMVLLDELGSGTDPSEGMGLATAILEQLHEKGATILATTHYSEIKDFANQHPGFINGSMEFDLETLQPTYHLNIGKGGESQAFAIALKLGIHPRIIERAHKITYKEDKEYLSSETDRWKLIELEKQVIVNKHKRKEEQKTELSYPIFVQGDNVLVTSTNEYGIVYKGPDKEGNYIVQIKGEKVSVNHKRLKLYISSKELYPEDYDFTIIFESKDNRKKSKMLSREHIQGLTIDHSDSSSL
ncbi:endonuclease MutS2 [Neobacillus sp. PS3-40]|uniref:endonuclease MutS2 n=1 Tax=Neobacillus sp. PS3-40 TaxID=3070679 RepID=UPI0027E08A4D|nr:endonuclease MutS2 [Neobacillus sp. PS3-40]WML44924.1 endonuclease MutS2 [Neobacillus sp. PS3-40]